VKFRAGESVWVDCSRPRAGRGLTGLGSDGGASSGGFRLVAIRGMDSICWRPVMQVPPYDELLRAHREGRLGDAELACGYVAERVRKARGSRWLQGALQPPLADASGSAIVGLFAGYRLARLDGSVGRALVAWAGGRRHVHLLFEVPDPGEVLAWQAQGERCVSLLPEGAPTAPHEDGLAFATHDLCHLEKFVDPAHHEGQKGFFRTLDRAMRLPGWAPFMARFDDELVREIFHVAADMNGSAIFLFAALKMKLKMASRRRVSAKRGSPLVTTGPLDPVEARAYEDEEGQLLDLLDLRGEARDAARAVSTRRDAIEQACFLLAYFEAVARDGSTMPRVSGSTHTQQAVASAKPSGTPSPPASPYARTP